MFYADFRRIYAATQTRFRKLLLTSRFSFDPEETPVRLEPKLAIIYIMYVYRQRHSSVLILKNFLVNTYNTYTTDRLRNIFNLYRFSRNQGVWNCICLFDFKLKYIVE